MATEPIPNSSELRIDGGQDRQSAPRETGGNFAASVVHEINNPLNALLNLLYLVEREAMLTNKGRQYLMLAQQEVHRISDIAHTALNEVRQPATPQQTNLPQIMNSVLDLYRSRFDSRGISVKTRYSPRADLPVYAGRLRQIFSNLLLNAADAMPNGGRLHARVSAAHEWSGRKRRGLRVTFADTGFGIPADKLPKILSPFFTTKGSGGSGLGLSVVTDVVRQHRGVLRVRSSTKPGHSGSVFAIFLPAA
jgi:signal transduction histidine kinase